MRLFFKSLGITLLILVILLPILKSLKSFCTNDFYYKLIHNDPYPLSFGCEFIIRLEFGFTFTIIFILVLLINLLSLSTKKNVVRSGQSEVDEGKSLNLSGANFDTNELKEGHEAEDKIKVEIYNLLNEGKFKVADEYYYANKSFLGDYFNEERYEKYKGTLIKKYFYREYVNKNRLEFPPDDEQAEAIGALGQRVLVSARAGSGKTETISNKVAFLCDKYDVVPSEILVLCFNNDAAKKMKEKICKHVPAFKNFKNARTFHSWAMLIVETERNSILTDSKKENDSPKEYSMFVKKLVAEFSEKNPDFKKEIYNFFRDESEEIDESLSDTKYFKTKEDRYLYLRNRTYITLNGKQVKSRGEKWIADFLFEHGLEFYYEQKIGKINSSAYHPDFKIKTTDSTYILEHWGINEHDPKKEVPEHWEKPWTQYKQEMNDKRNYFAINTKYHFIETSICDIDYNLPYEAQRRNFEEILRERLVEQGIECKKLPDEILINHAWEKQLFTHLETLVGQFIAWMQKRQWSESDLRNALQGGYNAKQIHFCNIGQAIYEEYQRKLSESKKIDFNILMAMATDKIKSGKYDVSHFKYVLIDEFQDFSQLFQNLVDAILEKNPKCYLFCVGDSWQLVNGFAGSDLKFFDQFEKTANVKEISTCYRSDRVIIEYGNLFANEYKTLFRGKRSQHFRPNDGEITIVDLNITWVEDTEVDDKFRKPFSRKVGSDKKEFVDYEAARNLKHYFSIVKKNPDKSFRFLCRKNKVGNIDLAEFKNELEKLLKDEKISFKKLEFQSMHVSKGLEADVVVLLDVCEKTIPSLHPTNELFEVFGRTPDIVLDEEKRLFYVALTRAIEKLYIVTETGKRSEFLTGMD